MLSTNRFESFCRHPKKLFCIKDVTCVVGEVNGYWAAHPVPVRGAQAVGNMPVPALGPGHALAVALPSTLPSTLSAPRLSAGVIRGFIGTIRPSDSSYLPIRLRLLTFPNRPGIAVATAGGMRSPRFRRVPFGRNGVFDHGRAVAPRMTVRNMLPSTFSTVSAPANLYLSRLNNPLHTIAVYASPWSSPSKPQHSLPGDPLRSYPFHRLERAGFACRPENNSDPN